MAGQFTYLLQPESPIDAASVGHKAAALWRLIKAGFPVPPAFCVTTDAFRTALAPHRAAIEGIARRRDLTDPEVARAAADAIAGLLSGLAVPESVEAEILALLPGSIGGTADVAVAVRSSATAEDRADASFAGQYETILGACGERAVLDAVVTCWRSFYSANALAARAASHSLGADEAMGVLIQRMVDAECSGVCFSVDPVRNDRNTVVLNAAWGLGPGVADGSVPADTVRLRRMGLTMEERRIVEKPVQIVRSPEGGIAEAPVPDDRRRSACLPEEWLRRLGQFAAAAENEFSAPQDIEWAIAAGQVWILQSRPIAGLPPDLATVPPFPADWKDPSQATAWKLDGDSFDAVLRPLEREVAAFDEAAWSEGILHNGGDFGGRRVITERRVFNGRTYVRSVPADLREGDTQARRAAVRDLGERLREAGITPWEHYAPEVVAATRRLATFDRSAADGSALADHLEDAFGAFRLHWLVHWRMAGLEGAFHDAFLQSYVKVSGRPEAEAKDEALSLLEGGGSTFTRLMDDLFALAETGRTCPAVAGLIADPPDDVAVQLARLTGAESFHAAFRDLLAVHGDRAGIGFGSNGSIVTPTWGEDPSQVVALIRPYIAGGVEAPESRRARANRERDAQVEALCASCEDGAAVSEFRRLLPILRRMRADLENHNHYIDQMSFGQLRSAILLAGRWLLDHGAAAEPDSIFWLERDEIAATLRCNPPPSLAGTVARRKTERAEQLLMTPPMILGVPEAGLDPRPPFKEEVTLEAGGEDPVLRGQAASAGRRRGRARIVAQAVRIPDLAPGEILVSENAGPMWTPIFPILGAIVLERGVLFQHAASTAREYGVPAVLNVPDATRRIPDGAWIIVDGTAGTVEIESGEG